MERSTETPEAIEGATTIAAPLDLSSRIVCEKCKKRYVEIHAVYTRTSKKGQTYSNCKVCRGKSLSTDFPGELLVPAHLQPTSRVHQGKHMPHQDRSIHQIALTPLNSSPSAPPLAEQTLSSLFRHQSMEEKWLSTLDPEQESLLRHPQEIANRLPASHVLRDLPHATSTVQWQAILSRLRDVNQLERLFQGYDSLRRYYKDNINTVSPVALATVSLNNAAIRNQKPFLFSWLDVQFQNAPATIFVSLNAQSSSEGQHWVEASPADRLQLCSVWQTSTRKNSQAIAVSYHSTDSLNFNERSRLAWLQPKIGSAISESRLAFTSSRTATIQDQFRDDSDDILACLVDHFHSDTQKQEWGDLQAAALEALHKLRTQNGKVLNECAQKIRDKQHAAM